jgi:para-aminobenzoate synthetase component 1
MIRQGGRARAVPGFALTPLQVLGRWPAERPLACVWADSGGARSSWSRWTVIAEPTECRTWRGLESADEVRSAWRGLALGPPDQEPDGPPFVGGWIGFLGYGLGEVLEPASGAGPPSKGVDRDWPQAAWLRCPGALVHDGWSGQWWAVGEGAGIEGLSAREAGMGGFTLGPLRSATGREGFERSVARAVEYIRAGDIFQVNLAHRLSGAFEGSTRGLFRALVEEAGPRHGAYLELPDEGGGRRAIVSASPELFLSFDAASRRVTTRPLKGTRPASAGAAALERSGKDRAELAMIVDLMRNDLGRVCEFGSIRVTEPRVIERHGAGAAGVYQGAATVEGRLRPGLDTADLLAATFPGGSVTGAPKVRAMQIIGELEPSERGPYCGAIGMVSDSGDVTLNIAIRTALVSEGRLDYSVGAGIVAESDPAAEWAETMDKAGIVSALRMRAGD